MIADDEPLIRRGIKQLIDLSSLQIGEIHEASTGEEALKVFEEVKPEIVLMDINLLKPAVFTNTFTKFLQTP